MSLSIIGAVDRFPWIRMTIETSSGPREIDFVIDTGFDGELAVPLSFKAIFGEPARTCTIVLANGSRERRGVVECAVRWSDDLRVVEALYINGENPLAGMEMFAGCRLTIDSVDRGEVSVEEL